MILEQQKTAIILSSNTNDVDTTDMSLDEESEQIIMQMFGKSMYSDPIGSIIREWTSNGIDSHRILDTSNPVIVSLKRNEENNYEFTVEDTGVGLSNFEVRTIISKYGKSTKRDKVKELGRYGIGWKSGLAYNSVFYFVCRQNNIENKYMMYEGEFKNHIDLLHSCSTDQPNGVRMILPVKNNDVTDFIVKIKEQLCYFENVYFDIERNSEINKFEILRTEDYQISSLCNDSYLHISLDDVYYPIDFNKLGINPIYVPIALKFNLTDGIIPIPNRENLLYNNKTKTIILEKVEKVANQLFKKYNKQIKELGEIYELVSWYEYYVKLNDKEINIKDLKSYSNLYIVEPNLKCFKYLDFLKLYSNNSHHMLSEFNLKHILKNDAIRKPSKNFGDFTLRNLSGENNVIYLLDVPITFKQKEYIKTLHSTSKNIYFIEHNAFRKLGKKGKYDYENYHNLLNLNSYTKDLWRDVIKEFQAFVELFKFNCIKISSIIVPVEHIEKVKKQRVSVLKEKKEKIEGTIVCKIAIEYIHDYNQCKFVEQTYNLSRISKINQFLVYFTKDKIEKLKLSFNIYRHIRLLIVNQKDFETLEKLKYHNCMSIETFEQGNTKPFKKVVTSLLIEQLIDENKKVFQKRELLKNTSIILHKSLNNLKDYSDKYLSRVSMDKDLKLSMIQTAKENNLFDNNMLNHYIEIKNKLEKLDFLTPAFNINASIYQDNSKDFTIILNMLFKYKKQRINKEHYNIKKTN